MFECDVDNFVVYFGQFVLDLFISSYGKEIWLFYEIGKFDFESEFIGIFMFVEVLVNLDEVM